MKKDVHIKVFQVVNGVRRETYTSWKESHPEEVAAAKAAAKAARVVAPPTDNDRIHASFIARVIAGMKDPAKQAAALADFTEFMRISGGRLGTGPLKFGTLTFKAPANARYTKRGGLPADMKIRPMPVAMGAEEAKLFAGRKRAQYAQGLPPAADETTTLGMFVDGNFVRIPATPADRAAYEQFVANEYWRHHDEDCD